MNWCHLPRWGFVIVFGALIPGVGVAPVAAEQVASIPSSNPLSGDEEAIEEGRRLYGTWCSQCHGGKADGVSRFGKYAADLTRFPYGFTEFSAVVTVGRPKQMMPPWEGVLDGEQIAQIGAYLETLSVEGAKWED